MLLSGTFTMAVMYLVLLCDSIVAGYYIGEAGVAAINAITPLSGVMMFFGDIVSIGASTIYAREVGAMRKRRADEIFGQGLIVSLAVGLLLAAAFYLIRGVYFSANGTTGEILKYSLEYYRFLPLNAFLTVFVYFLEQMVYSDGDELCNNICYAFQIGGNIVFSVILTKRLGMTGNILGCVIGNGLGILVCFWHFFRKSNTLHFVWHLSFRDFLLTSRYSIVDASLYLCWGLMDYVMIGFVSRHYGTPGLVALAMVNSLIEFSAIMDGVGLAMQPLISTYFGEKNHQLIKRVMKAGIKAALIEGAVATVLIFGFARQFCALFGVTGGASFAPSIAAVQIVSLGLTFCSAASLMTSYYMLIDHIGIATGFTCFQYGLLYVVLPMLGSSLWGINGVWAGIAIAPVLTLICTLLFVALRFGRDNFPFLLGSMRSEIVVMDDVLTAESAVDLPKHVRRCMLAHQYAPAKADNAAQVIGELVSCMIQKNRHAKKKVLIELSLFFEDASVQIIERDSGELFEFVASDAPGGDMSDRTPDGQIEAQREGAYLVTTGYNRNRIQYSR